MKNTNKENLGYKLGLKVKAYKAWKHPWILKLIYPVLVCISPIVMFPNFFGNVLMFVLCIIAFYSFLYVIGQPTTGEKILGQLEEINDKLKALDKDKKK